MRCANLLGDVDALGGLSSVCWVLKLRGELLKLNYEPYDSESNDECPLYGLGEREDTFHFVGTCPALSPIRLAVIGERYLYLEKFVNLLNGMDWPQLIRYATESWKFRKRFLNEPVA